MNNRFGRDNRNGSEGRESGSGIREGREGRYRGYDRDELSVGSRGRERWQTRGDRGREQWQPHQSPWRGDQGEQREGWRSGGSGRQQSQRYEQGYLGPDREGGDYGPYSSGYRSGGGSPEAYDERFGSIAFGGAGQGSYQGPQGPRPGELREGSQGYGVYRPDSYGAALGGYERTAGNAPGSYGERHGGTGFGEEEPGRHSGQGGQGGQAWGSQPGGGYGGYGQRSRSYGERSGFAGRGPKGYSRSDDRIKEDVCDRLSMDDDVDASDVEVRVEGGEVILEGTVQTRTMKHSAEDIADSVPGVKDVRNHLRVSKPLLTEIKDKVLGKEAEQSHAHSGTRNSPGTASASSNRSNS